MARPAKQPPVTFEHPARIEVRRAEFKLLASVAHLDVARLTRAARAEIELGYFETDCRQFVRATVQKGMVTDLVVEPCSQDEPEPASPELARLFEIARQRVAPPGGRPFRPPVPVADFMRNAAKITVDSIVCVQICIFGFCFVCCTTVNRQIWCGRRVIIHTP